MKYFLFIFLLLLTSCATHYRPVTYRGQADIITPYVQLDKSNTRISVWGCTKNLVCALTYDATPEIHNPYPKPVKGILICEYTWQGKPVKERAKEIDMNMFSSLKVPMSYTYMIMGMGKAEVGCYYRYHL